MYRLTGKSLHKIRNLFVYFCTIESDGAFSAWIFIMSKNQKKWEKKPKPKKFDRKTFPFGIFQGIWFLRSINFARQRLQIQGFIVYIYPKIMYPKYEL